MRLVNPVVLDPLRDEWATQKAEIEALLAKASAAKSVSAPRPRPRTRPTRYCTGFLERLARFRVLDPACGSGNFLLLSLQGLKDLEHQVILEAEALGLPRAFPMVGPENVLGIELNPYAAELARVTVWIGEIQWMLSHGFSLSKNPILKPLNTIEQNVEVAYMATTKGGAFDIPGALARAMMNVPNPHGRPNADVVKPWANGLDVTRRSRDMWIIDFGTDMDEATAALYECPFGYLVEHVKAKRQENRREAYSRYWWRFVEPRPAMRTRLAPLARFVATPTVAKHRLFVWMQRATCPDHQLIVVTRDDDATFGILHSRFHEAWALRMGTSLEDRPRYTPTSTFETFPFPVGLTPADTAGPTEILETGIVLPAVAPERRTVPLAIAEAAHRLNALRENWLNPPEWVERVPEVVPRYPDRIIPKPEHAAEIKKRTLTNLYNARPAWLDNAHKALDAAVAAAYGWAGLHAGDGRGRDPAPAAGAEP